MISRKAFLVTAAVVAGFLLLTGCAASAAGIRTAMGDDVKLGGYSPTGPFVYLFLTGPNLPGNGVALHDITKRADQGYFTKVAVDGDDHWTYTWHTRSMGGRLDSGTYTVWVVNGPNDRSNLASAEFATISVTLGEPYVAVDTPVQPESTTRQPVPERTTEALVPVGGTLSVNSTPSGASVLLDGADAGLSPVLIPNVPAGNHTVVLKKDGYVTIARQVIISAGQAGSVDVSLYPLVPVTTTRRSAGLVPAVAGALGIVVIGIAFRRRNNR